MPVLIVTTNEKIAQTVSTIVEWIERIPIVVSDIDEVGEALACARFDCMVVDLDNLPPTGLAIIAAGRFDAAERISTPVIGLYTEISPCLRRLCAQAGVEQLLQKPVRLRYLSAAIASGGSGADGLGAAADHCENLPRQVGHVV